MTERDLAFYLYGFFEMQGDECKMTRSQVNRILEKIKLVKEKHNSEFAGYLEAVIETPTALKRLTNEWLEQDKTLSEKPLGIVTGLRNVQKSMGNFFSELI